MINENFEIEVRSEICLQPGACYPVTTYLPVWITIILGLSAFFVVKDILALTK